MTCCTIFLPAQDGGTLCCHAGWRVEELNKAYALLADLAASLMYVMLVRDSGGDLGVPGGTHNMMYGIHGWAILFLQVQTCLIYILHRWY